MSYLTVLWNVSSCLPNNFYQCPVLLAGLPYLGAIVGRNSHLPQNVLYQHDDEVRIITRKKAAECAV
jgi:hypothetical protein